MTRTLMPTVLVVDDDPELRVLLETCLRVEGYDVLTAADVDSALLALDSDDFDVVISDIQMPGRTGLDLLHAVKDGAPQTVVIMITAFATTETAIAAMKQGAYDYLQKPFKVDEVQLVVERALERNTLIRHSGTGDRRCRRRAPARAD